MDATLVQKEHTANWKNYERLVIRSALQNDCQERKLFFMYIKTA